MCNSLKVRYQAAHSQSEEDMEVEKGNKEKEEEALKYFLNLCFLRIRILFMYQELGSNIDWVGR